MTTLGLFKSFSQIQIAPQGLSAFGGSITGTSVWMGCYMSQGLRVIDEPDAANGATTGLLLLRAGVFEVNTAERNMQPQKT